MKKFLLTLSSLALSVTIFAFSANANTKTRLTVDVPFSFTVGDTVVAPGEYLVEITRDLSGGATVGLVDGKGQRVALAIGRVAAVNSPRQSDLVFRKTGSDRTLSRIILRDHAINM
jgi:hypothetical protein